MLLAADVQAVSGISESIPSFAGDANHDGRFDQSDLVEVFQAGKYDSAQPAEWSEGDWNGDGQFDSSDLILAFQSGNYTGAGMAARRALWPELIPLPEGFEPEGIELGKGHDFFVGANAFSVNFGQGLSPLAGAIFKGDLLTGKGELLVEPSGKPLNGLSYDARTDLIYAATGDAPHGFAGPFLNGGVRVYDASNGALIDEVILGDGMGIINDVLVTKSAVYATDSAHAILYKIHLDKGGRFTSPPRVDAITLNGFGMAAGINANGLVGDFNGKELVVINFTSGMLYNVDTETGDSTAIAVDGAPGPFVFGDGLHLDGRTLYIMQNDVFIGGPGRIAVVQLSEDLTHGTFVKELTSTNFDIPTTIIGFGNSIYAVNTHFYELGSAPITTEVVKVPK